MTAYFEKLCRFFHSSTNVPLQCYRDETPLLHLPAFEHFPALSARYVKELMETKKDIAYLSTPDQNLYGIVKEDSNNLCVVIGPIISTKFSKPAVISILKNAGLSFDVLDSCLAFFHELPVFSFNQFLGTLSFFFFLLHGKEIEPIDILDFNYSEIYQPILQKHIINLQQTKEEQNFHNTYHFEQRYLKYIEKGNPEALKQFVLYPFALQSGIIADTNIRQAKNIFITTVSTASRAAIQGGLDIEQAYQLSDTYIYQMEYLDEIDAIHKLQFVMLVDFAERVSTVTLPSNISNNIYRAIQYICANTNRSIGVEDIATHIGKSRSYLSREFKKQMDCNLNHYILEKKLEEAKILLAYSEESISAISNYLCFSSQGYFQSVFKKKYDITPNTYRKKYR